MRKEKKDRKEMKLNKILRLVNDSSSINIKFDNKEKKKKQ